MKVCYLVPLVSFPFFAACSSAAYYTYNTASLKNINQEELAHRSFSKEETRGVSKDLSGDLGSEKVVRASQPSRLSGKVVRKAVRINAKRKGKDIRPIHVTHVDHSSESLPVIEKEERRNVKKIRGKREKRKKTISPFLPPSIRYTLRYTQNGESTYKDTKKRRSGFAGTTTPSASEADTLSDTDTPADNFADIVVKKNRKIKEKTAGKTANTASLYTPVRSEQELQEELIALKKTGGRHNNGKKQRNSLSFYEVQCELPEALSPARSTLNLDFLSILPEKKKSAGRTKQGERLKKKTVAYDFPIVMNRQVRFYLKEFQNRQRAVFTRWLERAAVYLPLIESELKKADLPKSLAYLAMIESGFNPSASSPAQATGLWQFMDATARDYGLRIDSWVDERRDPEKATRAAISYLDTLYNQFGDWQLAVAAYNGGEGRIERGLQKYKARTFWELAAQDYLPLETKRYVPKLIAAIIIAHDPVRYGFRPVTEKDEQYDIIEVPSRTPLSTIAAAGGYSITKIRKLNNELLKDEIPPTKDMYSLKVPSGSGLRLAADLEQMIADNSDNDKRRIHHRLRRGETLSGIGKRYNVSVDMILQWNDINDVRRIRAGRKLALYPDNLYRQLDTLLDQGGQERAVHYYKVRNGDSLWSIARKHQVSTREIKRWNRLNSNMLHPGKKLVIKKG